MSELNIYADRNRRQHGHGYNDFTVERYIHAGRYLPDATRMIVDVGCNTGAGAAPLRNVAPGARLAGLDCVPERIEMASSVLDEVHEGLANSLPFADSSACAVIACELIEHLSLEDAESFVAEVGRVLRPKGRFIVTTPNPRYIRLWLTGRSVLDDPAHLMAFTSAHLCRMLSRQGIRPIRIEGTGRMSRWIGVHKHPLWLYGSYMIIGEKS